MDDSYARPRAIPRALAAVVVGWAATLIHLACAIVVLFAFANEKKGDNDAGGIVMGIGYMLVLAVALILLPVGHHRVRRGLADGRVMVTAASVVLMPGFLCCTAVIGFAGMTYQNAQDPDAVRDTLALIGGLVSALACVALIVAIVYLWQPAVTRHFRQTLATAHAPRPNAPGQW